jgi:hypothetical protein
MVANQIQTLAHAHVVLSIFAGIRLYLIQITSVVAPHVKGKSVGTVQIELILMAVNVHLSQLFAHQIHVLMGE